MKPTMQPSLRASRLALLSLACLGFLAVSYGLLMLISKELTEEEALAVFLPLFYLVTPALLIFSALVSLFAFLRARPRSSLTLFAFSTSLFFAGTYLWVVTAT